MTTKKKPSLLKSLGGYKTKHNYDINKFRLNDRSEFRAHKKALYLHGSVCSKDNCDTCIFHNAVKCTYYVDNDLPRYNFGHHDLRDTKILKDSCRVTFNNNLDYSNENKQEKVEINWTKLQLATYFCCSLKEMMILNN